MQWVTPTLVAQIRFVEWTAEGHLRHAAYLGLRTDKRAHAVRRES
jgi:bifunctional non-homologous end joining protein LigD